MTIAEEYALNANPIEQIRRKRTPIESIIGLQMHCTPIFGDTTKDKGSGFGLHSCANYLIARHGTINAPSDNRGNGAEFVFVVPLAIDDSHLPHEGADLSENAQ